MRRSQTSCERRGAAMIGLALVLCVSYWLKIDTTFASRLRDINEQAELLRDHHEHYARVLRQGDTLR
ncbi:type II secretion system protein GspM, partial [Pseudomonas syringae pv. tagetis]